MGIDILVDNLHWSKNIKIDTNEEKDQCPYILPLVNEKKSWFGLFDAGQFVIKTKVGFCYSYEDKTYHIGFDENLNAISEQKSGVSHLPLSTLQYHMEIGKSQKSRFMRSKNSSLRLLGVSGTRRPVSLIYFAEIKDEIVVKSLYWNGTVKSINQEQPDKIALQKYLWKIKHKERKRNARNLVSIAGESDNVDFTSPQEIVRYLDRFVIGQDYAKKAVSVAFSNYFLRMMTGNEYLPINHLLCVGPSGVGKTLMLGLLTKAAKIPFISTKMTGKCSEGYRGPRLSTIFRELPLKDAAPYGIVLLDEIDKLAEGIRSGQSTYGSQLQNELIGYIDEADIIIGGGRKINSRNILFVTAGAFLNNGSNLSLEEIVKERMGDVSNPLFYSQPQDLIDYGIKAELTGRIPLIVSFHALTVENKKKILLDSELSPLRQYEKLLEARGLKLISSDSVAQIISEYSANEIGARGLKALCQKLFFKIIYAPENYSENGEIVLDKNNVIELLESCAPREKKQKRIGF